MKEKTRVCGKDSMPLL